jgi:glutamate carboxypeptidase
MQRITLAPEESLSPAGQGVPLPVGQLLSMTKRPTAPVQVLLVIHYDTVYPVDHAFRTVTREDQTLRGPGVADAKGGIVVMFNALLALERSPAAKNLGWRVLLNPDEEIGSPGSAPALITAARTGVHLGLVFEPAPAPQTMVTKRKGSGNFAVLFRGRSAHAGREIEKGRNAVVAAARFALDATAALAGIPDVTMNVAKIDGGGPANVVPDLAILRFNVRVVTPEQQRQVEARLTELVAAANRQDGIRAELYGHFSSPPWVMTERGANLFAHLQRCGRELGLSLTATPSGGASDANKIASTGLPVLDSLGPVGSDIHSENERVVIASLAERAKLSALLLHKLAAGQVPLP